MRTEYKRDMNHNYLIIHEDTELDTSSYQIRMLAGNIIPSLLNCQFHGVDGNIVFYYEITSKQSIAVLYEGRLFKEEDLRLIFGSFVQIMEQMAEYLLNPAQVLLEPEYMYMDVNSKEIFYCYLPGKEREVKEQLQALTEYILPKIDHGDDEAVMLGYGVYRWAMEDNFHLENIKQELFRSGSKKKEDRYTNDQYVLEEETIRKVQEDGRTENKNELEGSIKEELDVLFGFGEELNMIPEEKRISEHKKKGQFHQKMYIVIPVVGTVVIMTILAANMLGILPWLRVEILLMAVVICSMILSVICYWVGKIQEKKIKSEITQQWKKKVKHDKEISEQKYNRHYETGINPMKETIVDDQVTEKNPGMELEVIQNRGFGQHSTSEQSDYGETMVLSAAIVRGPATLVSKEPGELATIYLKDDLTVIGKLETAADAVIMLPTISRLHAKIRKREGEYYLADLNSRNGTSVNGRMLKVNEEYMLQDEDEVNFAEARYIFLK